jgi:hypothetical protein
VQPFAHRLERICVYSGTCADTLVCRYQVRLGWYQQVVCELLRDGIKDGIAVEYKFLLE